MKWWQKILFGVVIVYLFSTMGEQLGLIARGTLEGLKDFGNAMSRGE